MRPRVGIQFNGIFLVPHPSDARIFEHFFCFCFMFGLAFMGRRYLARCLDHNDW